MSTEKCSSIATNHLDQVHDLAYNIYGNRLATAGSDHRVSIWDKSRKGKWKLSASWLAHKGPVWKVAWAHPEFGHVIATSSFDKTVTIFEQISSLNPLGALVAKKKSGQNVAEFDVTNSKANSKGLSTSSGPGQGNWVRRRDLVDHRESVDVLAFAPNHHGLVLATGSRDGMLRIWEAPELLNLTRWGFTHTIEFRSPIASFAWNPSRFEPPMLAVATTKPTAPVSIVYENNHKFEKLCQIEYNSDIIYHVAWAPLLGRSFHMIATCNRNGTVKIFRLDYGLLAETDADSSSNQSTPMTPSSSQNTSRTLSPRNIDTSVTGTEFSSIFNSKIANPATIASRFDPKAPITITEMAHFKDHTQAAWKVEFNATGTILASSGDDGTVRLYSLGTDLKWKAHLTYSAPKIASQTPLQTIEPSSGWTATNPPSITSTSQIISANDSAKEQIFIQGTQELLSSQ